MYFYTMSVQNERLKYLFPDWKKYNLYKCEGVSSDFETDIECIAKAQETFLGFLHNEEELQFIESTYSDLHYPTQDDELDDSEYDLEEELQFTTEDLIQASYHLQSPRNQFDLLSVNVIMDVQQFREIDFSKPFLIN